MNSKILLTVYAFGSINMTNPYLPSGKTEDLKRFHNSHEETHSEIEKDPLREIGGITITATAAFITPYVEVLLTEESKI
jgi:hypothetical protein